MEMQVKTMSYHCTAIKIAKSRILITPNAGEDMEQQELSFIAGGIKTGRAILEDICTVSDKKKYTLKQVIMVLSIYPKELKLKPACGYL